MHFRALGMRAGWNGLCVMCDVCVVLPSLLWLEECLTPAAQMGLEMIFNLLLCRVCLCSPVKAHPVGGLAIFPSRALHAALRLCSCCSPWRFGVKLLLGTTLCTFPEEPQEELWRKISLSFPSSVPSLGSAQKLLDG